MTNAITVRLQKKRDAWERKVKLAFDHVESVKRTHNIYKVESTRVLERYQQWLQENKVEPILDLSQFK
jgi:hypothetical protein